MTLANSGNDFTGAVSVISGHTISIADSNALTLGAIASTGAANADGGNITVTAGGAITGTGAINASGGTAAAACRLIEHTGARPIALTLFIEMVSMAGRERLKGLPVFSVLRS